MRSTPLDRPVGVADLAADQTQTFVPKSVFEDEPSRLMTYDSRALISVLCQFEWSVGTIAVVLRVCWR